MDKASVSARPTRITRPLALYRERGAEIERTGPWTYLVPSCTGTGSWAVNYRALYSVRHLL